MQPSGSPSCQTLTFFILLFLTLSTFGLLIAGYALGIKNSLRELAGTISATQSGIEPSVASVTSTLALTIATVVPLKTSTYASSHTSNSYRYAILPGAAAEVIAHSIGSTVGFEGDDSDLAFTYASLDYYPLHQAYPVHAMNTVNPHIARQVKHNLRECVDQLTKRTEGGYLKGPNIGPTFEGDLLQCKTAIEEALREYYGRGHGQDRRTQIRTPRPANTQSLSYRHEAASPDLTK